MWKCYPTKPIMRRQGRSHHFLRTTPIFRPLQIMNLVHHRTSMVTCTRIKGLDLCIRTINRFLLRVTMVSFQINRHPSTSSSILDFIRTISRLCLMDLPTILWAPRASILWLIKAHLRQPRTKTDQAIGVLSRALINRNSNMRSTFILACPIPPKCLMNIVNRHHLHNQLRALNRSPRLVLATGVKTIV